MVLERSTVGPALTIGPRFDELHRGGDPLATIGAFTRWRQVTEHQELTRDLEHGWVWVTRLGPKSADQSTVIQPGCGQGNVVASTPRWTGSWTHPDLSRCSTPTAKSLLPCSDTSRATRSSTRPPARSLPDARKPTRTSISRATAKPRGESSTCSWPRARPCVHATEPPSGSSCGLFRLADRGGGVPSRIPRCAGILRAHTRSTNSSNGR